MRAVALAFVILVLGCASTEEPPPVSSPAAERETHAPPRAAHRRAAARRPATDRPRAVVLTADVGDGRAPMLRNEDTVEEPLVHAAEPGRLADAAAVPSGGLALSRERFRVLADGTIGCAEAGPLRVVRTIPHLRLTHPALTAQALEQGRCLTTFRVNEWALLRWEGDLGQMRLANAGAGAPPTVLHFLRADLVPAAAAEGFGEP